MTDYLSTWYDVKREFDRYEFTMPGYRMQLLDERTPFGPREIFGELAVVMFVATVPDTYNPRNMVEVQSRRSVPFGMRREYFPRWLMTALQDVVMHEVRENFKQDGNVIYDPHKESSRI